MLEADEAHTSHADLAIMSLMAIRKRPPVSEGEEKSKGE